MRIIMTTTNALHSKRKKKLVYLPMIRIDAASKRQILRAAARSGLNVSEFVREWSLRGVQAVDRRERKRREPQQEPVNQAPITGIETSTSEGTSA